MMDDTEIHTVPENGEQGSDSEMDTRMQKVIPPRPKRRPPRKLKFVAGLLAVLLPGAGHLYLGLLRKGISLIFIILLDIAAMLYFSSIGMQINVPLLILLAILIPVLYFYNIFDVLQSFDRMALNRIRVQKRAGVRQEQARDSISETDSPHLQRRSFGRDQGISFGILMLLGGGLLFVFRQKPPWLRLYIEHYAGVTVAALLLCGGLVLIVREIIHDSERYKGYIIRKRRVGRYTAIILLEAVGVLLLLDWIGNTEYMLLLLTWWPIIPVLWGVEYLLMYMFVRRTKSKSAPSFKGRFRLDLRGVLAAIVLAGSVFIVSEQEHYLHLWNRVNLNLTVAAVDYGEAAGSSFQKPPIIAPVELATAKISIDAINGDILLHRAPVEDVEIVTTVWVDQLEGVMAEAISEQSFVEVTGDTHIKITPKGKTYGESGKRQPRMDLNISLPENRRFNLEIRTMNGGITLQNVEAIKDISLETGNGQIILHRIYGDVKGKTLNGAVRARNVQGSVDLSTNGGDMHAWDVTGALKLSTTVGNVSAVNNGDEVHLTSKNGNLAVSEARMKLRAETFNGGIDVRSSYVGGDWDIYSAVGDINLFLPVVGDYAVDGSSGYGDIVSDIPELLIDKKKISGEVGWGEFKLHIEGNSNLNVRKY